VDQTFRDMFEAMKQTADGLILANQGIKRMAEAALRAREEHEDLRDTVERLESLVIEQGTDLRALRDELRKPRNGQKE
jgi:hypothetical protein